MQQKETYAGRVQNSGQQKVEALFPGEKKKNAKVHRGEDLRTGKKK